jgi:hypothetical protein
MALVEIENVQLAPVNFERLRGFALDKPATGSTSDVYDIEISGWVVGQDIPPGAVEVYAEGAVLRRVPLDQQRRDVAAEFPDVDGVGTSGFRTWVSVLGLEPGINLQVRAVLKDETRVRLGSIKLRHQPLHSGFEPTLQPLMLTTMGRAGTTWTMRLLSEHPRLAVHQFYPYEMRTARYWLHMLNVLSEPRDPYRSAQADFFQSERSWIGYNPFYPEPASATPGLAEWFGRTHVEEMAAFCQRSIEDCYKLVASAQGQSDAIYFAEKHRPDNLPWLVWELYPQAREVFLVRDFRDVVSSMLAYNVKHGRRVFGPEWIKSDEEFARFVRQGTVRLLSKSWPRRQRRAHLIRYEDLILEPTETLRGVLAYLDLDHDDATVDGMISRAAAENPEMKRHLTSSDVSTSLGRWRQSLDPHMQEVCNEVFRDVLEQFGYEV